MIASALAFAFACYGVGLVLNFVRLLRGPDLADRVLALDTMMINSVALIVLYGIKTGSAVSFEAGLLLAMTGFVSTVAFCKFMLGGNVIVQDDDNV